MPSGPPASAPESSGRAPPSAAGSAGTLNCGSKTMSGASGDESASESSTSGMCVLRRGISTGMSAPSGTMKSSSSSTSDAGRLSVSPAMDVGWNSSGTTSAVEPPPMDVDSNPRRLPAPVGSSDEVTGGSSTGRCAGGVLMPDGGVGTARDGSGGVGSGGGAAAIGSDLRGVGGGGATGSAFGVGRCATGSGFGGVRGFAFGSSTALKPAVVRFRCAIRRASLALGVSSRSRKIRSPDFPEGLLPPPLRGSTVGSMARMRLAAACASPVAPSSINCSWRIWSCSTASAVFPAFASCSASMSRMSVWSGHRSANSARARKASSTRPAFCIRSAYSRKFCFASALKPLCALILPSL